MSTPSRSVPVVDLEGNAAEMGGFHGERHAAAIQELSEVRLDLLCRRHGRGSHAVVRSVANRMSAVIRDRAPDVFAESAATAAAAGVAYWKLIVAGAFSDVDDVVSQHPRKPGVTPLNECTIASVRLGSGRPAIAGTWDTHASAAESLVLVRRRPTHGVATVALSTVGWPMQQGVTSNGVGFAVANLVASTVSDGLPYIAALPELVQARTARDSVRAASNLEHCSARFYAFADAAGVSSVEVVPSAGAFESESSDVHTNHFVHSQCLHWEGRAGSVDDSIRRRERLSEALADMRAEEITVSALVAAIRTSGVRQFGDADDDRTGAVYVIDPCEGQLHYLARALDDESEVVTVSIDLEV